MEAHEKSQDKVKRRGGHEGPKNHVIAFVISIVLTMLAFIAVMNTGLQPWFILVFIVVMAIVQVIVQLAFWMHMKDKGHFYAAVGLSMGAFVAVTALVAALYWMWW
jgi:cytochrome c oxidase subunit 4